MIKQNKEKNLISGKKCIYMLSMFLFVLLDPILLCGCASAQDEVTMVLSSQEAVESAAVDEPDKNMELTEAETQSAQQVYIYVCGAVVLPGVYCLNQGSRLYEAVELAGGLTGDADENCLNMARQIVDGEQILILTQEEATLLKEAGKYPALSAAENGAQTNPAGNTSGLVNINTATAAELSTVSGIGATRAQAIIDYREKNGNFGSIEDIKKVDGIKDGLFSKIKDQITT